MNKYNTRQKYGMGWFNESHRHSLARQGIKTGRKSYARKTKFDTQSEAYKKIYGKLRSKKDNPLESEFKFKRISPKAEKFYETLGNEYRKYWTSKVSYSKLSPSVMSQLQVFLHKHFSIKKLKQPKHIQESEEVVNTQQEIETITSWDKFSSWLKKHRKTLMYLGLGGLAGIIGVTAGVPTLMQNIHTGEIVAVGGTLIGRTGMITQTVLTGMGVIEEVKVISEDTHKELYKDINKLVKPEEIEVETPTPEVLVIGVRPKKTSYSKYFPNDDDDDEDLSEISSKPIPFSDLSEKERKVLYTSISKVKKVLGKRGKKIDFNEKNLQVCKRVGPDNTAFGAHQGNLIQIDRDTLKDQDKTEGVLFHEAIHKVYGVRDETRELENIQIDYLGELM